MNKKEIFDQFESCLEWKHKNGYTNQEAAGRFPDHQAELLELLDLADQLNLAKIPGPTPVFKAAARTRLINWINAFERSKTRETVTKASPPRQIRQKPILTRRFSMTWIIVISLLATALAGGGGVAYASTDALPGDTLYPVKTTMQDLELTFASDDADMDLLLDHMAENIQDMEKLAQQGRVDDIETGINEYVENFEEFTQTRERVNYEDAGSEESINQRLQTHSEALEGLQEQLKTQEKLQEKVKEAVQLTETGKTNGPNDGGKPEEPGTPNGAGPGEPGNGSGEGKPEDAGSGEGEGQGKPEDAGNGEGEGKPEDSGNGSGDGQGKPEDAGTGSGQGQGCQMTAEGEECKPEDIGYVCKEGDDGELDCKPEYPDNNEKSYFCEKTGDGSIICKPGNAGEGQNGQGAGNSDGSGNGSGKP